MSAEVLVAGAGPVGLMMANQLVRHGLTVRIIDKRTEPCPESRALAIWPRTLEICQQLGCLQAMLEHGNKIHSASIFSEGKRLAQVTFDHLRSPFRWCLMLPQSETERILTEQLEQRFVKVERGVELAAFQQEGPKVRVRLREGDREESLQFSWLIGCDGAESVVRQGLNLELQGSATPTQWALADVYERNNVFAEDEATMFFHPHGVAACFPFGGGRYRFVIDAGRPNATLQEMQEQLGERSGLQGIHLSDPIWLASFASTEQKVKEYRRGRVFLAGDAAHVHSPAGGQGMNTGLQDAYNLAWKMALVQRGQAPERLLESYSQERGEVGDLVLRNASVLTSAATLRNPVAQGLRDRIWQVVGGVDWIQRKIGDALGELNIHYPNSPLSREQGKSLAWLVGQGVHAGDRLPDGELERNGEFVRLFELMNNPQWNLFLLEGMEREPNIHERMLEIRAAIEARYPQLITVHHVGGELLDRLERIHRLLGAAQSALYLVRPDGYVGYRGQPAQGGPLLDYLGEILA